MNTTIMNKVDEFLEADQAFTSLDITTALRADGNWVMNSEVSATLRKWFAGDTGGERTLISVFLPNGDKTKAYLYHPLDFDPDEYVNDGGVFTSKSSGSRDSFIPIVEDVVNAFAADEDYYELDDVLREAGLLDLDLRHRRAVSDWLRRHVPPQYEVRKDGQTNQYAPISAPASPEDELVDLIDDLVYKLQEMRKRVSAS